MQMRAFCTALPIYEEPGRGRLIRTRPQAPQTQLGFARPDQDSRTGAAGTNRGNRPGAPALPIPEAPPGPRRRLPPSPAALRPLPCRLQSSWPPHSASPRPPARCPRPTDSRSAPHSVHAPQFIGQRFRCPKSGSKRPPTPTPPTCTHSPGTAQRGLLGTCPTVDPEAQGSVAASRGAESRSGSRRRGACVHELFT